MGFFHDLYHHPGRVVRDVVLPVGGAIVGGVVAGPAGAVAGASIGQGIGGGIKASSDAKKEAKGLLQAQGEASALYEKHQATLTAQLASQESKAQSIIARANRGRRGVRGGLFGGEVTESGQGATATLG